MPVLVSITWAVVWQQKAWPAERWQNQRADLQSQYIPSGFLQMGTYLVLWVLSEEHTKSQTTYCRNQSLPGLIKEYKRWQLLSIFVKEVPHPHFILLSFWPTKELYKVAKFHEHLGKWYMSHYLLLWKISWWNPQALSLKKWICIHMHNITISLHHAFFKPIHLVKDNANLLTHGQKIQLKTELTNFTWKL